MDQQIIPQWEEYTDGEETLDALIALQGALLLLQGHRLPRRLSTVVDLAVRGAQEVIDAQAVWHTLH